MLKVAEIENDDYGVTVPLTTMIPACIASFFCGMLLVACVVLARKSKFTLRVSLCCYFCHSSRHMAQKHIDAIQVTTGGIDKRTENMLLLENNETNLNEFELIPKSPPSQQTFQTLREPLYRAESLISQSVDGGLAERQETRQPFMQRLHMPPTTQRSARTGLSIFYYKKTREELPNQKRSSKPPDDNPFSTAGLSSTVPSSTASVVAIRNKIHQKKAKIDEPGDGKGSSDKKRYVFEV